MEKGSQIGHSTCLALNERYGQAVSHMGRPKLEGGPKNSGAVSSDAKMKRLANFIICWYYFNSFHVRVADNFLQFSYHCLIDFWVLNYW